MSRSWYWKIALGLAFLVVGMGCARLAEQEALPVSTPADPIWSEEDLREHLQFLNSDAVGGRATGTAGYATAAAYIAARMVEYGLQPAYGTQYRVVYPTPINEVRSATLFAGGTLDSLLYYPGVDYLADGRSDSGKVVVRRLLFDPGGQLAENARFLGLDRVVMAPIESFTMTYLETLRAAGVEAVLGVGNLLPVPSIRNEPGMMVMQVTLPTAAELLGVSLRDFQRRIGGKTPLVARLPRPLHVSVQASFSPRAGAVNVLGYVPGKHPLLARELVVVCTDLDAIGRFAGVPTLEKNNVGVATAAMLEVARQYGVFSQYGTLPERSVLFAVFSGNYQGHAGFQRYMEHPVWTEDQTYEVIYVGLNASEERKIGDHLDKRQVSFTSLPVPGDSLRLPPVVLLPEGVSRRVVADRLPDGQEPPNVRLADVLEANEPKARELARAIHQLLLQKTMRSAPVIPLSGDSLWVPVPPNTP